MKSLILLSIVFGFALGSYSGWSDGYRAGKTSAISEQAVDDSDLRKVGFCAWPKLFYAHINCGSIAPDYQELRQ